jgi:hypothetical protein
LVPDLAGRPHAIRTAELASADNSAMSCREGCAACCIAPSISTPIPGMPGGKPAGTPCVQLTFDRRCALFDDASRPAVCVSFAPDPLMCGASRDQALHWLAQLERMSMPQAPSACREAEGASP